MTGENLAESYRKHQRKIAIKHLTSPDYRTLTLGQIAKLMDHERHGAILASITLDELLGGSEENDDSEDRPNLIVLRGGRDDLRAT